MKLHNILFLFVLSFYSLSGIASSDLENIQIGPVSCSDFFCAAVGNQDSQEPVILQLNEGEGQWEAATDLVGVPQHAVISTVNCSTVGCVAGGWVHTETPTSFLMHSAMRGAPWEMSVMDPGIANDYLSSISCAQRNCVAVGWKDTIIHSTDAGATWTKTLGIVDLPSAPYEIIFIDKVSCVDRYCVLLGRGDRKDAHQYPLVAQSHDAGMTWHYVASISDNKEIVMDSISCGQYICAVAGVTIVNGQWAPKIYQTRDAGRTWTTPVMTQDLGISSVHVDCAERSCTMTARKNTGEHNFIYETVDGGVSWSKKTPPNEETLWQFQPALASAHSAAIGNTEQFVSESSSIVVMNKTSVNGAWTIASETTAINGHLHGLTCSAVRCVAVGTQLEAGNYAGMLLQSVKGGAWEFVHPNEPLRRP